MKRKILAGLILSGVFCFAGTACATRIIGAPQNSKLTPPPPPPQTWEGKQPPAINNGSNQVKPPVPPSNNVKPPVPPSNNVKPPVPPSNNVKPPVPPSNNGSINSRPPMPPSNNGNSNVKPPVPPSNNGSNNVKHPRPHSFDKRPPADFKPGEIKRPPQLKK